MLQKKILFLTPYPKGTAPSQRFRFEHFYGVLTEAGFEIQTQSFIDIETWNILYKPGNFFKKIFGFIKGIIRRVWMLFRLHRYKIVFIHREALPFGPPIFEWLIKKVFRKKIVFDFDDAIWLPNVSDSNKKLGWLKNYKKTNRIIFYANLVFAGNSYLFQHSKKFNPNVLVMPTVIDTNYHKPAHSKILTEKIIIGWTGTFSTLRHYEAIVPALIILKEKYADKIGFQLIADKKFYHDKLDIEFVKWNEQEEIKQLQKFDIGIMPLPDDEWAKGKCGFKGLQYMSLEIPPVMSPVGVNTEIIQDGVNGFLAASEHEWIEKLSMLIENPELRTKLGKAARQTVIEKYSVESQQQKYLEVFQSLCSK